MDTITTTTIDILLIEDSKGDAEWTIRTLKKYNIANKLRHMCDSQEALNFILNGYPEEPGGPKLILLDMHMPRLNGTELLQQIKADKCTKQIPVVMLTSSKDDPGIQTCYALGADSYLVKPVNFENFAAAMRKLDFCWLLVEYR